MFVLVMRDMATRGVVAMRCSGRDGARVYIRGARASHSGVSAEHSMRGGVAMFTVADRQTQKVNRANIQLR